ncbi:ERBB receptor feedback inhibitor 1a [Nematolebias whitei]|uniref:ERBB receptor feedback inhibitor 1a n=1 Tax=Nematolebias whitei TaxID=451745 RepID=UPI00189773AD|nr:ERBB receptor feedback inhibitor 1a [Nematolebias whitei]
MRSDCTWSMSTVGLTAQEISFPITNPFLRGSYCHSMAGSKPSWPPYHHEPSEKFYFAMDTPNIDHSYRTQQKGPPPTYERHKHSPSSQRLPPKKSRPTHLTLSCTADSSASSPADDDQVVPSFQRLSFNEYSSPPATPDRCSKPLPPIPPQTDISPEQAMDSEVEFFTNTDERHHLVSSVDQCSKSSPFRYGFPNRRSFRDCGQINYAYYDGPLGPQSHHQPQQHHQPHPPQQAREHYEQKRPEPPEPVVCPRPQDKTQRRLRRSHSGPAGSLHKPSLRLTCPRRHASGMDKPEVPPPIPPRILKSGDCRRWSAEVSSGAYSDEDKPPKLPPRDHLSRGSSRTPSPKSLPSYINGVMPPTQSFAPDPKYVSGRVGLHRQNSEGSPCILPVMENGKKASTTHYYLLPSCDCHAKRKVDLV